MITMMQLFILPFQSVPTFLSLGFLQMLLVKVHLIQVRTTPFDGITDVLTAIQFKCLSI